MGYYYHTVNSRILVPAVDAPKVEGILSAMEPDLYGSWDLKKDADGNIIGLYHNESKSYDSAFLDAIAPYVEDGGFVEIAGEDDDDRFRLVFRSGKVKKVKAVITFPEDEEANHG